MPTLPVDILERDWQRELNGPQLRSLFTAWREAEPALSSFQNPLAVLRFLRRSGSSARKDEVLCALLRRARWEPVAGRVVLEAMLPGLKKLAGRLLIDVRDREELWSILLSCAWERICTYPVQRRPRRVAANVLLDSMRATLATFSSARRDPAAQAECLRSHVAEALPESIGVDALLDAAISAGAVTPDEAELILATRVDGVQLSVLARSRGVSCDTLRHRRSRAERRLRFFLGRSCPVEGGETTFLGCSGRR
jgi:DNA-directed RNA polymerase specialized sigma24 family protein